MNDFLDMTPFMLRLTKARPDRLRVTIYVAPGRADNLVELLRSREVRSWAHSDSTVRVEDPLSVHELYEATGALLGALPFLRRYVELRSYLRPGQKRPPDVMEDLEEVVQQILEIQGD